MSNSPTHFPTERCDDGRTSTSELLRAVANQRRRTTLSVLVESSTPVDARTVARRVAEREAESDQPPTESTERVHVSLHHVHLPKLSDVGLASYDSARGVVDDAVENVDPLPL